MGIIIRTVFNNQGWAGPCKNPSNDPRCYQCIEGRVYVNGGKPITVDDNGFCKGEIQDGEPWCWEQTLCTKYFWGNAIGKWGPRAYPGEKVYLVYRELSGLYTLWGWTKVHWIDNNAKPCPNLYLEPFKPLSDDKCVRGLSAIYLTGRKWGQGTFRYIGSEREAILDSRIEGKPPIPNFQDGSKNSSSVADYMTVPLRLKVNITERLKRIAESEGREIEDIVREAIAEWLKGREF